jgi:hypothetical protein
MTENALKCLRERGLAVSRHKKFSSQTYPLQGMSDLRVARSRKVVQSYFFDGSTRCAFKLLASSGSRELDFSDFAWLRSSPITATRPIERAEQPKFRVITLLSVLSVNRSKPLLPGTEHHRTHLSVMSVHRRSPINHRTSSNLNL